MERQATCPTERLAVGADELTFRATSEATGGALLAVEVRIPPGGGPPALHRHAAAEIYRVEAGELAIYVDEERVAAGPGAVVAVPGGRRHTVRNESGLEARAYVVFAPGCDMEAFMRAAAGASDAAEVSSLAELHGIEMTG
jgi:mannose-6-phosphate isomerase-like protein (cupin superfamily)